MTELLSVEVIWLSVILASIFGEAVFQDYSTVWFAPAATAALVVCVIGLSVVVQIAVFFISSVVMIILFKALRHMASRIRHKNAHRDIQSNK